MIGRSTQLIGEIGRTEESTDIVASSPSEGEKYPFDVPMMQKNGVRSITPHDMIWWSVRLFWIARRIYHQ
jgi:hypothetical protein